MNVRRSTSVLAVFAASALILAGCNGDEPAEPSESPEATGTETPAAQPTGEPIRVGMLTSLTGPFTPWGVQVQAGMQMAVDEINARGGVDGRPLELVEADTQNDGDEATTAFERMIDQDGVVAVGGIISSGVGLATTLVAEAEQVPLFLVKAGAGEILTQASRYTFRTCLPSAPMAMQPVQQYVEQEGLTRVGAIVADYAWGQAMKAAIDDSLGALADVQLQIEVAPLGPEPPFEPDTFVRRLEELDPELIIATGHPPGAGPITTTAADLGIDVPIAGAWTPYTLIYDNVGDTALGKYSDFKCADPSDAGYQDLARRFVAATSFDFMEDDAVAGYGIVTMVAEAVGAVGDDPVAVAQYLHENSFELPGYSHTMSWTEWGELAESQPVFTIMQQMAPPDGINEGANWYPEVLIKADPLEPYVPG